MKDQPSFHLRSYGDVTKEELEKLTMRNVTTSEAFVDNEHIEKPKITTIELTSEEYAIIAKALASQQESVYLQLGKGEVAPSNRQHYLDFAKKTEELRLRLWAELIPLKKV